MFTRKILHNFFYTKQFVRMRNKNNLNYIKVTEEWSKSFDIFILRQYNTKVNSKYTLQNILLLLLLLHNFRSFLAVFL